MSNVSEMLKKSNMSPSLYPTCHPVSGLQESPVSGEKSDISSNVTECTDFNTKRDCSNIDVSIYSNREDNIYYKKVLKQSQLHGDTVTELNPPQIPDSLLPILDRFPDLLYPEDRQFVKSLCTLKNLPFTVQGVARLEAIYRGLGYDVWKLVRGEATLPPARPISQSDVVFIGVDGSEYTPERVFRTKV